MAHEAVLALPRPLSSSRGKRSHERWSAVTGQSFQARLATHVLMKARDCSICQNGCNGFYYAIIGSLHCLTRNSKNDVNASKIMLRGKLAMIVVDKLSEWCSADHLQPELLQRPDRRASQSSQLAADSSAVS